MAKQISKAADTVDKEGKVWETVGENIRNSGGGGSVDLKNILDILFPVGSYFVGDIPEAWKSVSTWEVQGVTSSLVMTDPDKAAFADVSFTGGIGEHVDGINFLYFKRTA